MESAPKVEGGTDTVVELLNQQFRGRGSCGSSETGFEVRHATTLLSTAQTDISQLRQADFRITCSLFFASLVSF